MRASGGLPMSSTCPTCGWQVQGDGSVCPNCGRIDLHASGSAIRQSRRIQPQTKELWAWFACGVALGFLVYFAPYGLPGTGIEGPREFELRSLVAALLILGGAFGRAALEGRRLPDWRWVVLGLVGVAAVPVAFFTLFLIECGDCLA